MSTPRPLQDAKHRFSELVERASEGEEIMIVRNGEPIATLMPQVPVPKRQGGAWKGPVDMAPDVDEADADIAALLEDGGCEK
jgi:antitoxin (DNA-binding transcriptional repressor) of toxin-antitoxin stability system